ncbi:hypothetical protein RUND412_009479 [Rhizina undulata]
MAHCDTGASMAQDITPIKNICAFLNAFHIYADDPARKVFTCHYCSHVNEDLRQCVLYDSDDKNARLIGIEYMITPKLYEMLEPAERKLWHSHVFEVKSGQLIMPAPSGVPIALWEEVETKEMESVIKLYGKTYHLWQTDKGHELPLGEPKLMVSFVKETEDFERLVTERDGVFGVDYRHKSELRKHIPVPEIHPDADSWDQSKA